MKRIIVTGITGGLSIAVAKWLRNKGQFEVSQLSVRGNEWRSASFCEIDCIVHIAGITPQNVKNEEDYFIVNSELTKELATKAKSEGVLQFIYISSMAVYGMEQQLDAIKGTISENTPCCPNTTYGKSKLQAERYLDELQDDSFVVLSVRVPSIYGRGKTEYLDQYKYLAEKLPIIPVVFSHLYKSVIYIDNLCELIFFSIKDNYSGVVCPDDGEISAVDFCKAIYPEKKCSRLVGKAIEIILRKNERIRDYYGAICYSKSLTNVFGGKYRVISVDKAVDMCYSIENNEGEQ